MAKAAKKRKKDEEDEEFEFPEFDEAKYLRHEIELAKATFVTIVLAIPVAVLLYSLTLAGVTIVAFFLGLGITFVLPRIFALLPWPKIDLAGFERKDWFGQGGTFLFSWLAFWILLINVPFADITPPRIESVTVNSVPVADGVQTQVFPRGNFTVNFTVYENGVLVDVAYRINDTIRHLPMKGASYSERIYVATTTIVTILAVDRASHEAIFTFTLVIQPP